MKIELRTEQGLLITEALVEVEEWNNSMFLNKSTDFSPHVHLLGNIKKSTLH